VVIAANCKNGSSLCYYWQPAGAGTWNPQAVDGGFDYYPSIAWTGQAAIIAAEQRTTSASFVDYWWQAAGSETWQKQQVYGPSSSDFGGPAIAATDGYLVVASGEENIQGNQLDYWWQPITSNGGWNLENPSGIGGSTAWTDPRSITCTGLSVVISSTTACGDLDYW
jgi:hypothetical protein